MGDSTAHGGVIVGGYPTVLIGKKPAARLGDPHVCPMFDGPKPHVGGVIVTSSSTVFIGGALAARVGDLGGCPSAGSIGMGMPAVVGPPPQMVTTGGPSDEEYFKKKSSRDMHAEAQWADKNKNGMIDSGKAQAYAIKMDGKDDKDFGDMEVGGEHKLRIGYGEAQFSQDPDGSAKKLSAEAGLLKQSVKLWTGDAKDDGANPDVSILGEWDLFHAEVKADDLMGDDGRRIGFSKSVKIGAEVISGKLVGTKKLDCFGLLDRMGYSLEFTAEIGGEALAVGAGAGAHAFYDRVDERFSMGIMGKLAIALGLKGNLGISFGKKRKASSAGAGGGSPGIGAGGIPNPIILGEFTVLIGG